MSGIICLADIEVNDVLHAWSASNSGMMEGVTIFGAVLLASLLAFIWVAFIRKQKRKRKRHHRDYVKSLPPAEVKADAKRRRSSRSRRHHASKMSSQRNPTLAEVGGLPPVRPDDQPPPSV